MVELLIIAAGLILLVAGAELLVRSSAFIATRLGVPQLVIGLTIVAFGTSAPELVASIVAALRQSPAIAIGNIVGSNITNGLLVAGATALITPIAVSTAALRRDGSVALGVAVVFAMLCALQLLNPVTGVALVAGLAGYIVLSYGWERRPPAAGGAASSVSAARGEAGGVFPATGPLALGLASIGCVVGIGLLAFGGRLLVDAAANLAAGLGVSEAVIGLTIVAVGTSLPELATSLLAALRRQSDIAIGNIIGSNIFNILGIGGVTALLAPGLVPARIVNLDLPIMLATTVILLLFAATGRRIGRFEGLLLVCGFCLYVAFAWLVGNAG